jgi:hypothetical protein
VSVPTSDNETPVITLDDNIYEIDAIIAHRTNKKNKVGANYTFIILISTQLFVHK